MNAKILLAVIAILLSVLLYQCKQLNDCKSSKKNGDRCVNYRDSSLSLINYTTASALFNKYNDYQKARIGRLPDSTMDANSTWFSFNTLKKYIYKIEDSLALKGIDPNIELGLRIYYGAYLDSNAMNTIFTQLNNVPSIYQHHHTVFMVPTFTDSVNKHYDFNPFMPLENKKPVSVMARFKRKMAQNNNGNNTSAPIKFMQGLTIEPDYILNHGEVAPPPRVSSTNTETSLKTGN